MPDKGEEIDKAQIKMPKRRTRMNTENYQTEQWEAKTMFRERERERSPKVQAGMKEATERNEVRKFYATACGMKAGSQP
jgi:hypothetical protein